MIDLFVPDRRNFLRTGGGLAIVTMLGDWSTRNLAAANSLMSAKHYEVVRVERTTVRLPYREIPGRNMDRELPHWRWIEICEIELKSGVVGIGETLLYYTWGVPDDEGVKRIEGKNAVSLIWDDSLGAGLQMALFDAVAKTSEVPIHCLLGKKINNQTPLSWWNIDTSAEDMAAECREAMRQGYRSYKTKGRPWFDVWKQVDLASDAVPDEFKIDMDFNDTLRTAEQAIPILKELEKYPQVDIYETPIPQRDVEGNKAICAATRVNIAMHYGNPPPDVAIKEDVCDGFVIGRGATRVMSAANLAAVADKRFWLQLVGTEITAAYSLHFGGVLSHATWPAVNCHQLYAKNLLTEPIKVENGFARVPDAIGLGYELNRDVMNEFKVKKPKRRPDPKRLIETSWPDGQKIYTANNGKVNFMLKAGNDGKYGFYKPAAETRLVPNDGSQLWMDIYTKARENGPFEL